MLGKGPGSLWVLKYSRASALSLLSEASQLLTVLSLTAPDSGDIGWWTIASGYKVVLETGWKGPESGALIYFRYEDLSDFREITASLDLGFCQMRPQHPLSPSA